MPSLSSLPSPYRRFFLSPAALLTRQLPAPAVALGRLRSYRLVAFLRATLSEQPQRIWLALDYAHATQWCLCALVMPWLCPGYASWNRTAKGTAGHLWIWLQVSRLSICCWNLSCGGRARNGGKGEKLVELNGEVVFKAWTQSRKFGD